MKKTKKVTLFLVFCLLVTSCLGCGQQNAVNGKSEASSKSTSSTSESRETSNDVQEEKEIFTIEHLSFGSVAFTDNFNNFVKDSEVYKELVKQTSCEIEEYGLDKDQVQVRIASGDLGDLIKLDSADTLQQLIESDLLLPLDELIEEYAPNILKNCEKGLSRAKGAYNDDNLTYTIPIMTQPGGASNSGFERYLYSVRWDLYKELGYPEMKNPDDLIQVLADMMELEPTNSEGKKVYGTTFYLDDTSYVGMTAAFAGTYGFANVKGHYILRNVMTNDMVYDFIDDGTYWMAVEYFNKAYRAGILDPDCFTQKKADYEAKLNSGQLLTKIFNDAKTYEQSQLEQDPNSIKGIVEIPVDGARVYNTNATANESGWALGSHSIAIPKSCKDPQRVMEFLNYTFSDDGSRLLLGGVEGVHWNYVNGVPCFTEETLKAAAEAGDEWKETGIYQTPIAYFAGMGKNAIHEDGYAMDLRVEDDYNSRMEVTPCIKDYCEYYNSTLRRDVMLKRIEDGRMYDGRSSKSNELVTITKTDEDILRIDSACMKIALKAIPKLVTAADDATFEAVKKATLEELKAAGAEEAKAFYLVEWESLREQYDK